MSILIQGPALGLNNLMSENALDPRSAATGTQNILYENGILKTPYGFAKLDLTTGLNSGDTVLSVFQYKELDNYSHLLAYTTNKIYEHDRINNDWDDLTGNTQLSNLANPVSYAVIAHNDTDIYLDDDNTKSLAYYHLVVCDGGPSNIQRWAGRYETNFGDVVGAGGYHDGTTHRALQVTSTRNRLILISPKAYSSPSAVWTNNSQRVRWPVISKLQTWTGTGSGFADLIDTGGTNVWSAPLGGNLIIYQTKGIWTLNYVGGSTVFSPVVSIPDLGLLSPGLLVVQNNIHYFVGTDYNIYSYSGGSIKQRIGDKVREDFQADLATAYQSQNRMVIDEQGKRLWIFIVPSGETYITKAYGMDLTTGAWTVRDFKNKFSTGGITAITLAGAETYITGDSYAEALDMISPYSASDNTSATAGDTTLRYGDVVLDTSVDWSSLSAVGDYDFSFNEVNTEFSEGGLHFCFSYSNDPTGLIELTSHIEGTAYSGLIMRIDDGSDSDKMNNGSHYFQIGSVCSVLDAGADYTVHCYLRPVETTGSAVADTSSDTPVLGGDTAATLYNPSGNTYNQELQSILVGDRMVIGDSNGLVYDFSAGLTDDDGSIIDSRHLTPVIDMQKPSISKRWDSIAVTAKGTSLHTGYRIGNFDTSDTGWTDFSQALTSDWKEYSFYINETSKRIQFRFTDFTGDDFKVREFELVGTGLESDR